MQGRYADYRDPPPTGNTEVHFIVVPVHVIREMIDEALLGLPFFGFTVKEVLSLAVLFLSSSGDERYLEGVFDDMVDSQHVHLYRSLIYATAALLDSHYGHEIDWVNLISHAVSDDGKYIRLEYFWVNR